MSNTTTKKREKREYELLIGTHIEAGPPEIGPDGNPTGRTTDVVYQALITKGPDGKPKAPEPVVFESYSDILSFNTPGIPPKFRERVKPQVEIREVVKVVSTQPKIDFSPLANMSLEELKSFAADEEIDLGTAKTKDEVLRVIRAVIGH